MTRKENAVKLFKDGYTCSQAVFMAYADLVECPEDIAAKVAVGFGNGISGMQDACGAATGMAMVAGMEIGKKSTSKKEAYPVVNKMMKTFEEKQGSCICRELLKTKDTTLEDGRRKGCIKCVEDACDIVEETFGFPAE